MKRKNIFKILVCTWLMASYSCSSDWLDVSPSDGITEQEAIADLDGLNAALNGVYDGIQGSNSRTSYYTSRMIYYGEVRGDDMQSKEATSRSGSAYVMNYTSIGEPQIWSIPYNVIRRANNALAAIEAGAVTDATSGELSDIKGQLLTARSLAHFDLLRVYSTPYFVSGGEGLGIPLVLDPLAYNYAGGRNTIKECYDQVIKDLTEAINLMPEEKRTGYFNKWAGKALLARVYLYKGDNENAYKVATDIIENSPYKLWSTEDYTSMWDKVGSSEALFEIVNFDTNDWGDRESIGYLYAEDGYEDVLMTKKYLDFVASKYSTDVREQLMVGALENVENKPWGDNKVYINKFPGRDGDIRINNIMILRLSEVYLIAAEAATKLNDAGNAAKYLNVIVKRGNPKAASVSASEATLDRVLDERRIELIGEGHRFFDLIRNAKEVVRYTGSNDMGWHQPLSAESREFDVNYFRTILPIPFNEVSANPILGEQQNPGY